MKINKILFTGVCSLSIMLSGLSNAAFADKNMVPAPPIEATFEEFEVWYNENFDDLREISDEYKTDKEILNEIENGKVSIAAVSYSPGDILVTDDNTTSGWTHGHAALVQNSLYTTEILKIGDDLTVDRSIKTHWTDKYSDKMAHLRPKYSSAYATKARDWLYNHAKENTIPYNLAYGVYDKTTTYCSKSAWQAWYYGANITLVSPSAGHVTPKMLYTGSNLEILSSNIGTWG